MRHLPLLALLGWAAAIFVASSIPNPPDAGGGEWQYEVAHILEYAVLGGLAFAALAQYRPALPAAAIVAAAWALAVLYGMSDEFHQSFVPNRDASWKDVGFDALGAAFGVLGAWKLRSRLASFRSVRRRSAA